MNNLADLTAELRQTHPQHLLDNSLVILSSAQLVTLRRFLDDLTDIGDGLHFVIERCVDENPGYNFSWDNDGSRDQDAELSRRIQILCKDIGFLD